MLLAGRLLKVCHPSPDHVPILSFLFTFLKDSMWLADAAKVVFNLGTRSSSSAITRRAPSASQSLISFIMDDPGKVTGSGAGV